MKTVKMVAVAVALHFVAAPAMAQAPSGTNENAHHYQGGPKTVVPHSMKHPKATKGVATTGRSTGGHHYRGGPRDPFHHMGDYPY